MLSTHARTIRHGLAMPTSKAFPIDWNPEPADWCDLTANMIEAACLLMRRRDGSLKANATLSGLTAFTPPEANGCLGAMGADDLERLVQNLRRKANLERAKAATNAG